MGQETSKQKNVPGRVPEENTGVHHWPNEAASSEAPEVGCNTINVINISAYDETTQLQSS